MQSVTSAISMICVGKRQGETSRVIQVGWFVVAGPGPAAHHSAYCKSPSSFSCSDVFFCRVCTVVVYYHTTSSGQQPDCG